MPSNSNNEVAGREQALNIQTTMFDQQDRILEIDEFNNNLTDQTHLTMHKKPEDKSLRKSTSYAGATKKPPISSI